MVLISISLSLFVISDVNGASVSTSLSQLPTSENETITRFNNTITNNDNAIYNSATFDLLGTYGAVMQGIKDNNSAYSALGLNDIGAQVGMTIRSAPTGEVNNGWVSNYDIATGKVNLSHIEGRAGTDYDVWNSADPNNDMMALTFNFGNMLDFNSNGAIDANEALYQNGYLENGFIGYEGGLGFGGNTPMFNYQIPEPSTTGLLGLGLAGALLYRRREPTQTPKNY